MAGCWLSESVVVTFMGSARNEKREVEVGKVVGRDCVRKTNESMAPWCVVGRAELA